MNDLKVKLLAKLFIAERVSIKTMKQGRHSDEWHEGDETWQLLGKAAPKQASARFADDVVRAVKLLPETDPFWPRILRFSRWSLAAACVILTVSILIDPADNESPLPVTSAAGENSPVRVSGAVTANGQNRWEQIEDIAQAELLAAAAEHLDEFSNQDLVTMIGF